ncbi:hypothetical protein [Pseudomonas petrae]|uniref:Helix-turn-helix domain-containing protein n=1 Tax=Pseudomonas petrae TaxID=2912190 RepID=A0ABS9ID43_9PSED|nr:hypothetical protein [Pseudomonas petrae]MCF7537571.1 hypothetical protein [Pseudomonas petrae]MCF7545623.1 hypothetical protein [Pseudomonas petrae]
MSIIRAPRPEGNFYLLNKSISEDLRLSWAARGVLVFLLGKPDHWEVSTHHLINQTKDCIGKAAGRDAIRGLIRELEQAGYLQITLERAEGGEFGGRSYTVSESPATDYPGPVEPSPANPPLVRTDVQQGLNEAVRTEKPLVTKDPLEGFDRFYKLYPRKQKRPAAEQAWKKLAPDADVQQQIIKALTKQATSIDWLKSGGQFIPHPASWLNGKRWEDEPLAATAQSHHTDLDQIDHTEGLVRQPDGSYRVAKS